MFNVCKAATAGEDRWMVPELSVKKTGATPDMMEAEM